MAPIAPMFRILPIAFGCCSRTPQVRRLNFEIYTVQVEMMRIVIHRMNLTDRGESILRTPSRIGGESPFSGEVAVFIAAVHAARSLGAEWVAGKAGALSVQRPRCRRER